MTDNTWDHLDMSASSEADIAERMIRRVAVIALLSILLGFAIQGLILAARLAAGANFAAASFIVDLTQGVTWSLLVCTGVGIGTAIVRARAALVGMLGLVCAPVAFAAAKSGQKMMSGVLGVADPATVVPMFAMSGIKAIEYGLLGWLLGRLAVKAETRAGVYLGSGALIGLTFGLAITGLSQQAAIGQGLSPTASQIAASLINEVVFPIGCALVVYVGQLVSRSVGMLGAEPGPTFRFSPAPRSGTSPPRRRSAHRSPPAT